MGRRGDFEKGNSYTLKLQMIARGGRLHLCAVFQVLSGLKEGK
jgi:hypothetical protein